MPTFPLTRAIDTIQRALTTLDRLGNNAVAGQVPTADDFVRKIGGLEGSLKLAIEYIEEYTKSIDKRTASISPRDEKQMKEVVDMMIDEIAAANGGPIEPDSAEFLMSSLRHLKHMLQFG